MSGSVRLSRVLGMLALSLCTACTGGATSPGGGETGVPEVTEGDLLFSEVDIPAGEVEVVGPTCQSNQECAGQFEGLGVCQIALCDTVQQLCVVGMVKDYTPCDDDNSCTADTFCLDGACGGGILQLCDDGNSCTDDSCDPAAGCLFSANSAVCDDGNECTQDDVCANGKCGGTAGGCPCQTDADCPVASNDNLCKFEQMTCVAGLCELTQVDEVVCDTSLDEPCLKSTCDPKTGECALSPITGSCSDGNTCTVGDLCLDGVCKGGDNMCGCSTDDDCDDFEDGNLCNGTLKCLSGLCAVDPATIVNCPQIALGPCEVSKCNPQSGVCQKSPKGNGTSCSDGDTCTDMDKCQNGQCAGAPKKCDDANPCTEDKCDAGAGCVSTPTSDVACSDGDECTTGDVCVDGVCQGGEFVCGNCGDQVCDGQETCESCPADCGDCPVSDCCTPKEGPGCGDEAIKACVCAQDAYCCETQWDDVCVGEVEQFGCGKCGGVEPVCGDTVCDPAETCESCPDDCGTCPAGDCCVPVEIPGCSDATVEACVCAFDDYCCKTAWDDVCVGEAVDQCALICQEPGCGDGVCGPNETCETCEKDCGPCVVPVCGDTVCDPTETCQSCEKDCGPCPVGNCCEAHEIPGCDDKAVEACVCAKDGFCCQTAWDGLCVQEVEQFGCGLCGAPATCGDAVCDPTETCVNCEKDCGPCVTGPCCEPHAGTGCEDPAVTACVCAQDAYCCQVEWDTLCVNEVTSLQCGDCGVVVMCGNQKCEAGEDCTNCPADCGECPASCGDGKCDANEMCNNCAQDCGSCSANSCCVAHEEKGCGDMPVADCVCAMDAYCCTVQWDSICAAEADQCGSCAGDCCVEDDTPGCDDETIEACVCDQDPFCCDVRWDALCAEEVASFQCGTCQAVQCGNQKCEAGEDCKSCPADCGACPATCGDAKCDPGEHCENCPADCGACSANGCCLPHDQKGCKDQTVTKCVCAMDPYCCANNWDSICAGEADQCGSCNGDCCKEHANPGCDDETVEACVCAQDPYCCETAWDGICVNEVTGLKCGECGAVQCGNQKCEAGEDCKNCPADCGACPAACGDAKCDAGEHCENCPADCGPCSANGCCLAHDQKGCKDPAVTKCVCALDPFCCTNNWDSICAGESDQCGSCNGDCCKEHSNPGCDDETVEACICAQDPYCCNTAWDGICVNEVTSLKCGTCGAVQCGNQKCEAGEDCKNCPADCGACPAACGDAKCDAGEHCDNCPADCGACSSNGCCLAHDQKGCKDPAVTKCVCALDPFCCTSNWDSICAGESDQCGSCNGDCCKEHSNPGCDDETVEACVCAQDSFCCNTAWDGICVNEVTSLKCGTCGAVQCGNQKCEAGEDCKNCPADCGACPAACGDSKCDAGEHCESCPADCGACSSNGCCLAHDLKGCKDPAVTKCVCAMDAYCCTNHWDSVCAGEADQCGSCNGDCCKEHANPGCDDETVEACVCAQDSFCCNNSWDGICAGEVTSLSCGTCQTTQCGNKNCEAGEDCKNCPADCGACPAACGNSVCETGEQCSNCPQDCGACSTKGCCLAHDQKGCKDPAVTKCVCALDPFCCTNNWDSICASEADQCGSCNGDCCKAHANPGCDGETVEACVCAQDSFCCDVSWDSICAAEVTSLACGTCAVAAVCGDAQCNGTENCQTCPGDCGQCCGNGQCQANLGEDSCSCPGDCPDDPNTCSPCQCGSSGGNCWCDADCVNFGDCCGNACQACGACPAVCGDGKCNGSENCQTCPGDCGQCCGNGQCQANLGENSCTCAADCPDDPNTCSACQCGSSGGSCWCDADCVNFGDCCGNACQACGACPAVCGDGKCNGTEDSCSCPGDCPDDPNTCSACQCGKSGGSCWCDDSCVSFGDCCGNACAQCGKCVPDNSCQGRCGQMAPAGCWCDAGCAGFGDCCPDKAQWCP